MAWSVGNHKRHARGKSYLLGCYTACPKNRHFSFRYGHRVPVVGRGQIADSQGLRVPDLDGRAMHLRVFRGYGHSPGHELGRYGPHAYDHWTPEAPCRHAGDIRPVHWHVASQLDMAYRHAGIKKGPLESEAASNEKRHEIFAPQIEDVRALLHQSAAPVHPVLWHVSAQIRTGRERTRDRIAGIGNFKQGAGPRIDLAKRPEVKGVLQ